MEEISFWLGQRNCSVWGFVHGELTKSARQQFGHIPSWWANEFHGSNVTLVRCRDPLADSPIVSTYLPKDHEPTLS